MLRHLNRIEEYAAVVLLGVMTVLVFTQVFLRFVLGLGYGWIEELSRVSFVWVVYLGAIVGIQRHLHLRVTVLIKVLPKPLRQPAAFLGDLVLLAFCAAMAWFGTQLVLSTLQYSFRLPSTGLSMFWPYLIIPLSFGLQALRLVVRYATGDRETHHV